MIGVYLRPVEVSNLSEIDESENLQFSVELQWSTTYWLESIDVMQFFIFMQ